MVDFDKTCEYLYDEVMPSLKEMGFVYYKSKINAYWLLVIDNRHSAHLFINYMHGYIILEINSETI
jgi:hypothetical protein